jgi:putative flippase GtrA
MGIGSLSSMLREMTSKRTLNQMWKFGTVGLLGVGINLGLLTLLVEVFGWYYLHAAGIAIVCAGAFNFTLNKFFTFDDRKKSHQDKDHP